MRTHIKSLVYDYSKRITNMKYLKTYETFGVWSDDLIELEHILRDLEDDGIRVDVNHFDGINVYLTNSSEHEHGSFTAPDTFLFSQIKHNIEHLVSYLDEEGYEIDSIYNIVDLKPSKVEYEQLTDNTEVGRLEFRFKLKKANEGIFGRKKITDWKEQYN